MCPASSALENTGWLETLLALTHPEQQASFLRSADLFNSSGISLLLDEAMRLARSDPGKARLLTTICANTAREAGAPQFVPRATYVRAQTHAINGEFSTALELIDSARREYQTIGEDLEALRTNLGLMHVLNELGRHHEAITAGKTVLDALENQAEPPVQANMITAVAYSNLGVCYETMGRYEEALDVNAIAESRFTDLQMTERISDVSNNRGIVLMHLGRVSEALAAFEKASRIMAEAGLTLLQAQTLSNMGEALLVLGDYSRSLNIFEQARSLFEKLDAEANKGILFRKTADAYLALNLFPEALSLYMQANQIIHSAGMADHQARALWGMGTALLAQAQLEEAATALHEAASLFETAGNIPMLSSVLLEQSALQMARGQREASLRMAHHALELVRQDQWPVQRIYACMGMADQLLPDTAAAESYLLEAQQLARTLNLPLVDYRLNRRFGRLRLLEQRYQAAQSYLEAALDQIESLRGSLAHESLRASFLQDKTAVYEDLLKLHLGPGETHSLERAFAIAEQAKSRALVDLIAGAISPDPVASPDPALARRLEALQADLSAIYNKFLDLPGEDAGTRLPELQGRALRLEKEISELRLRAAALATQPDPFRVAFSVEDVQEHLPPDLGLVAYHVLEDEILAFVLWKGNIEVVRHVSRISRVQDLLFRLNAQWERFRIGADFVKRHLPALENTAQRILAGLYTELFAPLPERFQADHPYQKDAPARLVIVPHGLLHQVPFHALFDGQRYLLEVLEISYALSATAFTLSQLRDKPKAQRGLVVAHADALIPAAEAEARVVAEQLAQAGLEPILMTGSQALRESFKANLPGNDVLHLACHGLFRSDNPLFSSVKLFDGWVTAADVLQLRLHGTLVALSACESGRSRVISGDEVIGLPRAFLGAGAATVLVSLWLVPDETTTILMSTWYERMGAGLAPVSALRSAQLSLKARHPHPFYWAQFIMIGQR